MRLPGRICGLSAATGRPCSDKVSRCCIGQWRRAAANWKEDGTGWSINSDGSSTRESVTPMPNQLGSPEAKSTVGVPRRARMVSTISGNLAIPGHQHPTWLFPECGKPAVDTYDGFCLLDQDARVRAKCVNAGFGHADYVEPGTHCLGHASPASALTAAEAMALPPRRPVRVR